MVRKKFNQNACLKNHCHLLIGCSRHFAKILVMLEKEKLHFSCYFSLSPWQVKSNVEDDFKSAIYGCHLENGRRPTPKKKRSVVSFFEETLI